LPKKRWRIQNKRINKICELAWKRLPNRIRKTINSNDIGVSDTKEWDCDIKAQLESANIKWNNSRFNPNRKLIEISIKESEIIPDAAAIGSFVHEIAHAYQSILTPRDFDLVEKAGDSLPVEWGFSLEILALEEIRKKKNS
jgi:hypothetical protein